MSGLSAIRCPGYPPGLSAVRAIRLSASAFGDLRAWEIEDIELGPDLQVHLNFMLLPATAGAPAGSRPAAAAQTVGFWSRRVPNPTLAVWQGRAITLRIVAIAVGAVAFLLGGLTMLALGRRFGIETRRLSTGEVGDMILNPPMPAAGERVTPIAVAARRCGDGRLRRR